MNIRRALPLIAAVVALVLPSVDARAGLVFGNPVVLGTSTDTSQGATIIFDTPLVSGRTVSTWSFFGMTGGDTASLAPTAFGFTDYAIPLLLTESGSNFTIVGIGTPRTGIGLQTFDFGLVAGTNAIGPDTFFGWVYNNGAFDTPGGIAFDFGGPQMLAAGPSTMPFPGSDNAVPGVYSPVARTISLGQVDESFICSGGCLRTYSAEVTSVPEPSTLATFGTTLVALIGLTGFGIFRSPNKSI